MKPETRGSAGSGLGEWIIQRVSAVYILLFILLLSIRLGLDPVTSYADWQNFAAGSIFRVTALLFIVSLLLHAWTGMKSVLLDYVHNWRLRFLLVMMLALVSGGLVLWAFIVVTGL